MLTYELDAYIFSDDWHKANAFKYDYIGAPWFSGFHLANKGFSDDGRWQFGVFFAQYSDLYFCFRKSTESGAVLEIFYGNAVA